MSDVMKKLIEQATSKITSEIPAQKEKIKLLRQSLELAAQMGQPQPDMLKMLDSMEAAIDNIEKGLRPKV
jgi:hypothetical protein